MKNHLLTMALLAAGTCTLSGLPSAHGGSYRGPGDTVPPAGGGAGGGGTVGPAGPAGPSQPGNTAPTTGRGRAPNGIPGGTAVGATTGGAVGGVDLSEWFFWWEFNKEPYLNLKWHVQSVELRTGEESWFLDRKNKALAKDTMKPTEAQIRDEIVPALLAALEGERDDDIVSGALIALAKIGDAPSETGDSAFEKVIAGFLSDASQEISETAAVALGILANERSIPALEGLLLDTPEGRKLVGRPEVSARTRAFAAYGLGLIGANTSSAEDQRHVVALLGQTLENDSTKTRDLKVSCVIALGLVPLSDIGEPATGETKDARPPESSRCAQLDYLLSFLQDENQEHLVRAHCPAALVRLLPGLPAGVFAAYRERVASDLIERLEPRRNEDAVVVQSAVLALGLIGTNDGANPLDRKIRQAVAAVAKEVKDLQAKHFSMIALAKIGGTVAPGGGDAEGGIAEVADTLLGHLAESKGPLKAWAGLACGVMVRQLGDFRSPKTLELQEAVRLSLKEANDPTRIGAFAIAAGIMGDIEAAPILMEHLARQKDESARGYVALALGLMNERGACETIQKIVTDSKYQPDLLKQAAVALGLLGDKQLVPKLTDMLSNATSLATQASISSALGFIGDSRSIDPLVKLMQNGQVTGRARGFAAVALGIVADKEPLPWNSRIGIDLNYRAATSTLTDPTGSGILDIL